MTTRANSGQSQADSNMVVSRANAKDNLLLCLPEGVQDGLLTASSCHTLVPAHGGVGAAEEVNLLQSHQEVESSAQEGIVWTSRKGLHSHLLFGDEGIVGGGDAHVEDANARVCAQNVKNGKFFAIDVDGRHFGGHVEGGHGGLRVGTHDGHAGHAHVCWSHAGGDTSHHVGRQRREGGLYLTDDLIGGMLSGDRGQIADGH